MERKEDATGNLATLQLNYIKKRMKKKTAVATNREREKITNPFTLNYF